MARERIIDAIFCLTFSGLFKFLELPIVSVIISTLTALFVKEFFNYCVKLYFKKSNANSSS